MNLCRLAQSLESDTVLLIFKNLYPHQACITETLNISRIHPRNLGLNQDLHESHLGNIWYSCGIHMGSIWDPHGKYMGPTWERHGSHNESQINPIWDPFKTHFHSLCGSHMGNPYGAYIPAHMDPIWDLYTHVVWVGRERRRKGLDRQKIGSKTLAGRAEGRLGMSDVASCLESQGCYLIPLFYLISCLFFCLVLCLPSLWNF